jgi:hypothetical protein
MNVVNVVKASYEPFAMETIHSLNNIYWINSMSVALKSSINSILRPPSRSAKSLDNPNQKHPESKSNQNQATDKINQTLRTERTEYYSNHPSIYPSDKRFTVDQTSTRKTYPRESWNPLHRLIGCSMSSSYSQCEWIRNSEQLGWAGLAGPSRGWSMREILPPNHDRKLLLPVVGTWWLWDWRFVGLWNLWVRPLGSFHLSGPSEEEPSAWLLIDDWSFLKPCGRVLFFLFLELS